MRKGAPHIEQFIRMVRIVYEDLYHSVSTT
jgi:hypothetical protein